MKTMNLSLITAPLMILLLLVVISCQNESKTPAEEAVEKLEKDLEKTGQNLEENLNDAMSNLEKSMNELKEQHNVKEPISFRLFKPVVKEEFAGLPQVDIEGSNTGTMGLDVAMVKAKFKDGDQTANLEIIDTGGLGMAAMGFAAWTMAKIDKESKNGYERTTTFKGHKAYEKCENKRCELMVFVNDRVVYKVEATNVDMDDVKDDAEDDIEELESVIKKNS